jgi:signal transduction histidine kinase
MTPRRLWASLGFRLAFYYACAVVVILLVTLGIVHLQTVGVMHQAIERQVRSSTEQLLARHAEGGLDAVVAEVNRALGDEVHAAVEIYLVLDPAGRVLAGNIEPVAAAPSASQGEHATLEGRQLVRREGRSVPAHLQGRQLPGGGQLVVGQDLGELEVLQRLLGQATVAAGMVALALLVAGTFVFRIELERSIAALRHTAARIGAGELQERVELQGDEDEFALLKHDINQMLDRIQQLMGGVRHVSDTIAHNLRTPLTRAVLRLRAAQEPGLPPQARQAALAAAQRDLQDLSVTFEKLLQIAEAEAGTRRGRFGPVALHAVADEVVELYDALAESCGSRLLREGGEVIVEGDRDLLAGAIANLVDNALKYAGAGVTVRVSTAARPEAAVIAVQDDGPGVPPAEHARMGSRFHRLDRSRPGYGLGLASVRAIAQLHGGQLRFSDAGPGLRAELQLPAPGG